MSGQEPESVAAATGKRGGLLYRKLPIPVEMMQLTNDNYDEVRQFANHLLRWEREDNTFYVYDRLHDTWVELKVFDWIALGTQGEFYPIAKGVQETTYEPVHSA